MWMDTLSESSARKILRPLRKGSAPAEHARDLFVGQTPWFKTAVQMMQDTAADEAFEVRFVRAAYGGGKTLFLRCLEQEVRENGWGTAFIILKHKHVELDRLESLAAELCQRVELPSRQRGMAALLRAALSTTAERAGYKQTQYNSAAVLALAKQRINTFSVSGGLSYDFNLAIQSAMVAFLDGDQLLLEQIAHWLGGANEKLSIDIHRFGPGPGSPTTRASTTQLKPIGSGSTEQLLRLVALLMHLAGAKGLFVAIDELELIGGLPDRRRRNAFQTLRALVDQNDPALQPPATSLFLAATPEMFEDQKMFPSYKALQDRIESLPSSMSGRQINYRANVIDLDKTELGPDELLALGSKIVALCRKACQEIPADANARLSKLVRAITARRYVIARPRLLCRCVVDLVEAHLGDDLEYEIAVRNEQMVKERNKEVMGDE
jgi:hypothetical protein